MGMDMDMNLACLASAPTPLLFISMEKWYGKDLLPIFGLSFYSWGWVRMLVIGRFYEIQFSPRA